MFKCITAKPVFIYLYQIVFMQLRSRFTRKAVGIVAAITFLTVFGGVILLLLNSKSIKISSQDKFYIQQFLSDWHYTKAPEYVHRSFETELNFISLVQDSVLSNITGEQIPHVYFGNVSYYYKKRQGICYDRAVLIEKILSTYNFKFRHVYIFFGKETQKPAVTDFFKNYIISHAALEVKTKKGWIAIGTDANWLGISKNGQAKNYYDVRKELEATKGNPKWQKNITIGTGVWNTQGYHFRFIYGIYSRHGDFFTDASSADSTSLFTGKRHFLPDYNLRMLLDNL